MIHVHSSYYAFFYPLASDWLLWEILSATVCRRVVVFSYNSLARTKQRILLNQAILLSFYGLCVFVFGVVVARKQFSCLIGWFSAHILQTTSLVRNFAAVWPLQLFPICSNRIRLRFCPSLVYALVYTHIQTLLEKYQCVNYQVTKDGTKKIDNALLSQIYNSNESNDNEMKYLVTIVAFPMETQPFMLN